MQYQDIFLPLVSGLCGIVLLLIGFIYANVQKKLVDILLHINTMQDYINSNSLIVATTLSEIKKDLDTMKGTIIEMKSEYNSVTRKVNDHEVALARIEEWRKSLKM